MTGNSIELDSISVEVEEYWISYSQMTVPQMLSAIRKWVMINYPMGPVKSFPHPPVCSQDSWDKWLRANYLIWRYLKITWICSISGSLKNSEACQKPFVSYCAISGSCILFELWQGWYMYLLFTRTNMDIFSKFFTFIL